MSNLPANNGPGGTRGPFLGLAILTAAALVLGFLLGNTLALRVALVLILVSIVWVAVGRAPGRRSSPEVTLSEGLVEHNAFSTTTHEEHDLDNPELAAPAATSPAVLTRRWTAAQERHDAVLRDYLPYETDPVHVLEFPALTDVRDEHSAAFFDALHDADILRTDQRPDDETAAGYVEAVRVLARAWAAAEQNARRLGNRELSEQDRSTSEQIIRLLRHADGASSAEERQAYVDRAYTLLRELTQRGAVTMPPRAMRAIEARRRRELED